jgi:hypothetical protein
MWQLTITWPDEKKTVDLYQFEGVARTFAAEAMIQETERCDGYKARAIAVEVLEA